VNPALIEFKIQICNRLSVYNSTDLHIWIFLMQ